MTTPVQPAATGSGSILDNAICVAVTIKAIGNRKQVAKNQIQTKSAEGSESDKPVTVDAERDVIRVTKAIFESPQFKAIQRLNGEVRSYLYRLCLPSQFKSGFYLLPDVLLDQVNEKLGEFKAEQARLAAEWTTPAEGESKSAYEKEIEAASIRLRGLFNSGDYLTPDEVRAGYDLEWQFVNFGVPGRLQTLSPGVWEAEKQKAAQKISEAAEAIQYMLREHMAEFVGTLADKLTGERDGGKPKVFRDSSVENFRQFLTTFELRNITNDAELAVMVDRAKQLMSGVKADDLRKNQDLRTGMASAFSELRGQLDGMLVNAPGRRIRFDEEEG